MRRPLLSARSAVLPVALFAALLVLGQRPGHAQTVLPPVKVVVPPPQKQVPKRAPKVVPPVKAAPPPEWTTTVQMSPVAGSALPLDKVPAGITVLSRHEITRAGTPALPEVLNTTVPGVLLNEALGNPLAADLQYRGFSASPLNGTPQGLAIYQNGVRLNEVFGDSMNWDLIPLIAIADITLISNNPVYGLNALGGAVNVTMKNGFTFQGGTLDTRLGSFGYKEVAGEAGKRSGNWGVYIASEWIDEAGWRDLSPADAKRVYADIGVKSAGVELHLGYTFAKTHLGVVGPTPVDLVSDARDTVFTSPQSFDNTMHMLNLSAAIEVSKTLSLSGNLYYRSFSQKRPDGNVSEAIACGPEHPGMLCFEEDDDLLTGHKKDGTIVKGIKIADLPKGMDTILGGNDSVRVDSYSFGGALQAVSKAKLFGLPNQLLVGASLDQGRAHVRSQSELGVIDAKTLVVTGLGIIIDQSLNDDLDPGDVEVTPVDLIARTQYYGLFFMNTLDLTDRLAFTVGGRYSVARIKLEDQLGDALNGTHTFERFNPMAGATYKLAPGLSVYAGYSESTRAPTPAELACADPARPCLLENFLVSDPPLKQVVSRTVEAGIRGQLRAGTSGRDALGAPVPNTVTWSLGYFHTQLTDDILTVASPVQGRGYFLNAGETLREGVEASIAYRSRQLLLHASYAYVNATFRTALELPSPDAPVGVPCSAFSAGDGEDEAPNCAKVQPGDRIPLIPRHRFKLGMDYWLTPQWRIGGDLIAASSQFLRGDEGNDDTPLAGFAVVNLRTAYKLNDSLEIYGLVKNLFATSYATFGTYYDAEAMHTVAGDPVLVGPKGTELENPRTITPAPPLAVYGGLRLRF